MCPLCVVAAVKTAATVEDVVTLVVMVGLVAAVEVALVDEVEVVRTGQILFMALMYRTQLKTLQMKNGGNLHIANGGWLYVAQAQEWMNGWGHGGCNGHSGRNDGCSQWWTLEQ
jgi:hypothetical protein